MSSSIRRITKHLTKKDRNAVKEAMEEMGMDRVEQIDPMTEAAIYKAVGVNSRTRRCEIRHHLRHNLGPKVFTSGNSLMELNAGHSDVFTGVAYYCKKDGEKEHEKIEYSIENMAREVERQTASVLESNKILLENIKRIDLTTGGNHGQGALPDHYCG